MNMAKKLVTPALLLALVQAVPANASNDPVTADPNTGANFNRYYYANNNPYRFKDPDGRATCAAADCSTSYIDATPMAKRAPPMVNGDHGLSERDMRSQQIRMGGLGPRIGFQNDDPAGASPNQPISTKTARMIETTLIASGVQSVNINSTTGGHKPPSNHIYGKAVDINRVNGQRADSPLSAVAVRSIQNAAAWQFNIRENFGPAYNQRSSYPGAIPTPITSPRLIYMHRNHVHLAGQE